MIHRHLAQRHQIFPYEEPNISQGGGKKEPNMNTIGIVSGYICVFYEDLYLIP